MRVPVFLFVMVLSLTARADYSELEALVEAPEYLQGRFEQTKYLADLDTAITSSGRFSYQRDVVISWHTLEPIENQLMLTPDNITSRQGGTVLSRLETQNNPVVSLLSDLFFGVMTASWERIAGYFNVDSQIDGTHWQAVLIPISPDIEGIVSRVELKGDHYLREVLLFETGGNQTRIQFHELQQ